MPKKMLRDSACACVHATFCILFSDFGILKPFLTEKEKQRHFTERIWHDTTFLFYAFFSVSVRKCSKIAEMSPKNGQNIMLWLVFTWAVQ